MLREFEGLVSARTASEVGQRYLIQRRLAIVGTIWHHLGLSGYDLLSYIDDTFANPTANSISSHFSNTLRKQAFSICLVY